MRDLCAGEHISAYYTVGNLLAIYLCLSLHNKWKELLYCNTREGLHITRLLHAWTCNCNKPAHINYALLEEFAYSGKIYRIHCPDNLSLLDRGDICNLDTHIACRVRTIEDVQLRSLYFVERRCRVVVIGETYMHIALSEFCEHIYSHLKIICLIF